mgnify:FL=1
MNEDMIVQRELDWWEHYPLHQVWCNDLCPLVPRFEYRPGDEWNANNWYLHWLIFKIWSLEDFSFGFDINIESSRLSFGFILPYLRVIIGFHQVWNIRWPSKLFWALRRKPALKNDKGEYN